MYTEDWDEPEILQQQPQESSQTRTFGGRGRGRGFKPIESANPGMRDKSTEKNNDDNSYWVEDVTSNDSFKPSRKTDNFKSNRRGQTNGTGFSKDHSQEGEKPKRQVYVPQEISNDENELFSNGISSGINFNKYDDTEVKVSGENIPNKISKFDEAGLSSLVMTNIKKSSYKKPTPIQKHAIPIIMSGRDLMACAQTGSGKTAAFLIPIVNSLLEEESLPNEDDGVATPQVLVVTPTRELAIQIYIEAKKFTFGSALMTEICYGGTAVRHQMNKVQSGCNLLIGTPGRLSDFLKRKVFTLSEIRYFVFDEADRMLDMSFLTQVEEFLNHPTVNKNNDPRILMFSATFPEEVQRLATKYLRDYLFLAVGVVGGACTDVEQRFYPISKFDKRTKLIELLGERGSGKTLVFVEKKRTADIIAAYLSEKDYPATSMHGDREQVLREEALKDFKSGRMDILVATAVAARGLDIKNVSHVINFDLPRSVDEYVHRIGRTGRVGNRGLATSFFDAEADSALAPELVRILAQAQQEVPDFLQQYCRNGSWTGSASKFGGRDIRVI
ncbi:UNVERIFIED_CONTAM: hypothetical protein PYX00_000457 [Menopon gallinae]|uniref:RNA helicase n=1 Tax=Menopon gallinae TaxID=328185 RepID=A0AAW2I8M2_9NEOP